MLGSVTTAAAVLSYEVQVVLGQGVGDESVCGRCDGSDRQAVGPGALVLDAQQLLIGVLALDIADGQITSVGSIANPDKLAHLGPVGDFGSLLRSTR
jgi:hypothetical protein